jgi:hypothetical protein
MEGVVGGGAVVGLVNICVSPKVHTPTYLPGKIPVPSIKSCFVKSNVEILDFSQCMEFFTIDLNGTDVLNFYVLDVTGQLMPHIDGALVIDVRANK